VDVAGSSIRINFVADGQAGPTSNSGQAPSVLGHRALVVFVREPAHITYISTMVASRLRPIR